MLSGARPLCVARQGARRSRMDRSTTCVIGVTAAAAARHRRPPMRLMAQAAADEPQGSQYGTNSHKPMSSDPRFGVGFYSDNTKGCCAFALLLLAQPNLTREYAYEATNPAVTCAGTDDVIQSATPLAIESVEAAIIAAKLDNVETPKPFVIADYGTADGGTSMPLMYDICAWLRNQVGPQLPIQIIYEDQPLNTWHDLFMRLEGMINIDERSPSYLQDFSNVFVSAVGRSFYKQVVPSATVHFGFSATAMHWLTTKPAEFSSVIHHTLCDEPSELQPYADQAAADWELILTERAKELVTGGRLVVLNFCVDEKGQYLGTTDRIKNQMWSTKNRLWWELQAEGTISISEARAASFANYYRTVGEFRAPFDDPNSVVSKAGLRLVNIETRTTDCPYQRSWERQMEEFDVTEAMAAEHAKRFVPTTRTWSNSVYRDALDAARDSPSDSRLSRDDLVDLLFERYAAEVAKAPEDHAMDYVHAFVVVEKV